MITAIVLICLAYFLLVGLFLYGFWREIKNSPIQCPKCDAMGKIVLVKRGESCTCGWREK